MYGNSVHLFIDEYTVILMLTSSKVMSSYAGDNVFSYCYLSYSSAPKNF